MATEVRSQNLTIRCSEEAQPNPLTAFAVHRDADEPADHRARRVQATGTRCVASPCNLPQPPNGDLTEIGLADARRGLQPSLPKPMLSEFCRQGVENGAEDPA